LVSCVYLTSHVSRVTACQTRSSEDLERKSSHKIEEPVYHKENKNKDAANQNSLPETQDKDGNIEREREAGEVQVGKIWEFPVAQVKLGNIWGTVEESRGGKRILAFRGIRHVLPPTGERRFRPPVPATAKWAGVVEAKRNGHVCPQHMATKPDIWVGDEDCLWLSVFTRDLAVNRRRPVVVWIHGGNFARGSAAEYEPDYILDEDVVLVTIQYRLGMFGFLSSEDAGLPGNYGMLDQVAALQWVKQNIEAFSGDSNRITLMGQQAGGASVHYHILSPLTRGLFNRAISMSGSALCWWASLKRPLERAKKLAKLVDCPQDDKQALAKCLREKPTDTMMNTHPNFYEWKHLEVNQEPMTSWSPRVDIEAPIPFMPQEPIDLITSGNFQHVPYITGVTDDEGSLRGSTFFSDPAGVNEFQEKFETLGPLMFGFHDGQSEAPKIMAKKVKDFYLADQELSISTASQLIDAISDSSYAHPIDTTGKIHAMKSRAPVFVYHFGYRGQFSMTQLKANHYPPELTDSAAANTQGSSPYGVSNSDDLMYLFPIMTGLFRPLNPEDLIFSSRFIKLVSAFATTGKPEIDMGEELPPFVWEPVNPANISHLDIGNVIEMDQGLPNHRRMSFWQSMPVYWNCNREAYAPAPPPARKEEL